MGEQLNIVKQVLRKLLQPSETITDNHLKVLLKYLTRKSDDVSHEESEKESKNDLLMSWLSDAITLWEIDCNPSPEVITLALNIAVFMASDENMFIKLNSLNTFERFITKIKYFFEDYGATPNVGYLRLISSFLDHNAAYVWLTKTNYWSEVIVLTLTSQTGTDMQKEGSKFITKLLIKSVETDQYFSERLIKVLISPLKGLAISVTNDTEQSNDKMLYDYIMPSLNLLVDIMDILITDGTSANFNVMLSMCQKYYLVQYVQQIIARTNNEDILLDLNKIVGMFYWSELIYKFIGKSEVDFNMLLKESKKFADLFMEIARLRSLEFFLKYVYFVLTLSYRRAKFIPKLVCRDGFLMTPSNQLLYMQCAPVIFIGISTFGKNPYINSDDELREIFARDSIKSLVTDTIRIIYILRAKVRTFQAAEMALDYLQKSVGMYPRDVASRAAKLLIYCLGDCSQNNSNNPEKIKLFSQEWKFFSMLMETITIYIKEFDITWKDCLETMTLIDIMSNILSFPVWPSQVVINGLELVEVAIAKYMSYQMAMLLDQDQDNIMGQIGAMVYSKLNDEDWGVRQSALKVVETMSHNSNKKFALWTKIITDAGFPLKTFKLATTDYSPFVRAAAFRCLKEMCLARESFNTSSNTLWKKLLEEADFFDQLLRTIISDSEGSVRGAAATLIATIYELQNFDKDVLLNVFNVMSDAATHDEIGEVRIKAMEFWKKVIDNHLTAQGMIDGTFPEVTFSKEDRKIVNLTDAEIKKRLVKSLFQLGDAGCLAVLVAGLNDANEEVAITTTNCLIDFYTLLKKYNISSSIIFDRSMSSTYSPSYSLHSSESMFDGIGARQPLEPAEFLTFVYSYFEHIHSRENSLKNEDNLTAVLSEILNESRR